MLIKWITCEVSPNQRTLFSTAQRKWSALSGAPGFIGQTGGWDQRSVGRACILGMWEGRASYEAFMTGLHDTISDRSDQASTYTRSDVRLFASRLNMPGERPSLRQAVVGAGVLRVARCVVRAERVEHFVEVQERHWGPGMARADGMLGGLCSEREGHEFLVTTAWRDVASHDRYMAEHFPALRAAAGVEGDLLELDGAVVVLEEGWRVPVTTSHPG